MRWRSLDAAVAATTPSPEMLSANHLPHRPDWGGWGDGLRGFKRCQGPGSRVLGLHGVICSMDKLCEEQTRQNNAMSQQYRGVLGLLVEDGPTPGPSETAGGSATTSTGRSTGSICRRNSVDQYLWAPHTCMLPIDPMIRHCYLPRTHVRRVPDAPTRESGPKQFQTLQVARLLIKAAAQPQ